MADADELGQEIEAKRKAAEAARQAELRARRQAAEAKRAADSGDDKLAGDILRSE